MYSESFEEIPIALEYPETDVLCNLFWCGLCCGLCDCGMRCGLFFCRVSWLSCMPCKAAGELYKPLYVVTALCVVTAVQTVDLV
jgi:hypothetical protein